MGRRDEGARRGVAERGERDAGEALADDQVMRAVVKIRGREMKSECVKPRKPMDWDYMRTN